MAPTDRTVTRQRPRWTFWRAILFVGIIYAVLVALVFFISPLLIFPAPSQAGYTDSAPGLLMRQSNLGDDIALIHLPAEPGQPTILASHGNAEDIGSFRHLFGDFVQLGIGVLVYDYPGYGLSSGRPSESSCYAAAQTAWDYLIDEQGVPARDIIIFGRSVGSGPSVWLANSAGKEARALALLSPFTSAYRTLTQVPLFPGDRFVNIERIPEVTCPVIILHGDRDRVVPFRHGQALYEAASSAKRRLFVTLEDTGHNDLSEVWRKIVFEVLHFTDSNTRA